MDIVLSNPDLIRFIYSFGDASHRQHMKKLEKELKIKSKMNLVMFFFLLLIMQDF